MKKFEYVYFTIYLYCSKQSYFHDSLYVRLKSMYVLALSAGGWLLLLQMLFLRFVKNSWFSSHSVALFYALSVYTAITFLFYRVFIVKERDQTIYNRFATAWNENPNKKRDLMLASLVAAAPYLVMLSMKIFLPR